MKLFTTSPHDDALRLDNTADALAIDLQGVTRIELHFPKFTDGRAYSQAHVLRRRGFQGEIRAIGDVLADQLILMRRCGFSSAVLRADQTLATAQHVLSLPLPAYQGDATESQPVFARRSLA
ncbi:MAG: DUF934 domain-containing protein [Alphaproteobacteria bacterium]|nr:DUF934 domain-containing protein [Alphaproteobacteria bacterium]